VVFEPAQAQEAEILRVTLVQPAILHRLIHREEQLP
jgi:hypothetical protein